MVGRIEQGVEADIEYQVEEGSELELEKEIFQDIEGIVIKIGTASITSNGKNGINCELLDRLASDCFTLLNNDKKITIVSSGAIALGRKKVNEVTKKDEKIQEKKRYASIGQPLLMRAYTEAFDRYGINVAQLLVTHDDFDSRKRLAELRETYFELISRKEVPIFNENDPLATEEITLGDNDILAAYITRDLNQDLLLILTKYDGLIKNGEIVSTAHSFAPEDYDLIPDETKEGRGGLESKLKAAEIVTISGKKCIISSSSYNINEILSGYAPSTQFMPQNFV